MIMVDKQKVISQQDNCNNFCFTIANFAMDSDWYFIFKLENALPINDKWALNWDSHNQILDKVYQSILLFSMSS